MDLCYWLQSGTHDGNKLAPELIWLRQHICFIFLFFWVQERCWGLHVFLWSWRVHCSPACQAGPDRFTCVTEWGWGGGFRPLFFSLRSCLVGWWQISWSHMTHHTWICVVANHSALTPPAQQRCSDFSSCTVFAVQPVLDGAFPSGHRLIKLTTFDWHSWRLQKLIKATSVHDGRRESLWRFPVDFSSF